MAFLDSLYFHKRKSTPCSKPENPSAYKYCIHHHKKLYFTPIIRYNIVYVFQKITSWILLHKICVDWGVLMKALGLIVEYNPFHNGHLYHLQQSRAVTGCEYVICVMSGNFIQRGEPALVNKWARARMALLSGVDLVLELPAVYAVSSAEFFAYGAVKILDSLGIVDSICFGSESGRIEDLDFIAGIVSEEPEPYKLFLKENLDKGLSFPAAREAALKSYLASGPKSCDDIRSLLNSSNNILGIEYLKALKRLKSRIKPHTIRRISNSYHTGELTGAISSATAIRKNIFDSVSLPEKAKFFHTMPESSISVLKEEFKNGTGPVFSSSFDLILLSILRKTPVEFI